MSVAERFSSFVGLARSLIVYYGQPWRRYALRRFYQSIVQPGQLVFDIGAHVGSRSKTLINIGAAVVAVEPQPVFADFLQRHLAASLKGLERVALGRSEGHIDLLISSRHPTVTSISSEFVDTVKQSDGFRGVDWNRKVRVPMKTLDWLIEKHGTPAFCKIDVEGAEADVLAGLTKPVALVAFEYIPSIPSVAAKSIQRLLELGDYSFNRVVGETHRFTSTHWATGEEILKELARMSLDQPSGDVYARLEVRRL